MKDTAFQVVVIGAGLAGLSAAIRSAESGVAVCVIEREAEESYLCASRMSGGLFHVAMEDMGAPAATVRANIERMMEGTSDPALADALAANSSRTLDWLRKQGIRFIGAGPEGFRKNSLSPPGIRQTGCRREDGAPYWVGRCGDTMLRTLGSALERHGGRIIRGVEATGLLMHEGRCTGVTAHSEGRELRLEAEAVVIADGGFQSDPTLLKKLITAQPDGLLQRNARTGRGAGLRMAVEAGARLVGLDRFYGHLVHRDALQDDALWPYPVIDSLATAGIIVDVTGRRFCDEGWGGVHITNEVAKLADPLGTWVIFDQAIWDGPAKDWLLPPNPYLPAAGGRILQASTLDELASKAGINATGLSATVEAYNRFVLQQQEIDPPRRSQSTKPWPIAKGPFLAVPAAAGITYAMGGIATDASGRVLREPGEPIPGLYAVGACTGGLEGGGHSGYSGGLSKASVFGMLAGEHIASTVARG